MLEMEDALKLLIAQEEIARQLGMSLQAIENHNLMYDPGIASQPAFTVKGRLEILFVEYKEAHKILRSAMESSMNRREDFRAHQDTYLLHSNQVHKQRANLDRIIQIQKERKAMRETAEHMSS